MAQPAYQHPVNPATYDASDPFGRIRPATGNPHLGSDYAVDTGTPVASVAHGRVVVVQYSGILGWIVGVLNEDGIYVGYGHLSSTSVAVGQYVGRGDRLGLSGNTGSASQGPHLHISMGTTYGAIFGEGFGRTMLDPFARIQSLLVGTAGLDVAPIAEEYAFMGNKEQYDYLVGGVRRLGSGRLIHDGGPFAEYPIDDPRVTRALIVSLDRQKVWVLPANAKQRMAMIEEERKGNDGLFLSPQEGSDVMTSAAFDRLRDANGWTVESAFTHGWLTARDWGTFVQNEFDLESGSTRQRRTAKGTVDYPTRQQVWRDGREVVLRKGGNTVTALAKDSKGIGFAQVAGAWVQLTPTEVARADAQVAGGYTWGTR